jgi:hypothetical protein
MDHLVMNFHLSPFLQLKRKNQRKENSRIGAVTGSAAKKSGEYEEDILPSGGKSEVAADLKKYTETLWNLHCAASNLFK